jgi:hypothetical protein
MPRIIETEVDLAHPLGHHLHCLVAQIPTRTRHSAEGWRIIDPDAQWRMVRSVLDLVAQGPGNLKRLHFLLLPESAVPHARLDDVLDLVASRFRANTVTLFGLEHVRLRDYRALLERFRADNAAALALVDRDIEAGDILDVPVNWICVAVKEASGKLRVFLEAKTHPFHGEEFLDAWEDLYRGRHVYLFRSAARPFNFMALVCLDLVYRNLYASNIRQIVDHANQLFFRTRQALDVLFVVQANPKPDHRVFRDVLAGLYGEYLEDTPGVRDTVTVLGNCSDESAVGEVGPGAAFGGSSVVISHRHRLAHGRAGERHAEYATDDFGGAPLWRLRFGTGTRLYYLNIPTAHEIDPRSSRLPLKVHAVMRRAGEGWAMVRPVPTDADADPEREAEAAPGEHG